MAKYWRLKISPSGGNLKGVFISLHSSRSDIYIFRRDNEGRPYHCFEDNVPAATALVVEVFRRYSKPGDILLPALMSQKPGVVVAGVHSVVETAKAKKTWSDWNAYLREFERWTLFSGDLKKSNPRKQYSCEVRQVGNSWEIVELKKREW